MLIENFFYLFFFIFILFSDLMDSVTCWKINIIVIITIKNDTHEEEIFEQDDKSLIYNKSVCSTIVRLYRYRKNTTFKYSLEYNTKGKDLVFFDKESKYTNVVYNTFGGIDKESDMICYIYLLKPTIKYDISSKIRKINYRACAIRNKVDKCSIEIYKNDLLHIRAFTLFGNYNRRNNKASVYTFNSKKQVVEKKYHKEGKLLSFNTYTYENNEKKKTINLICN